MTIGTAILLTSAAGCGEIDDDVATETSAITAIIVGGRPMADVAVDPPDGAHWSVYPASRAPFDAINETTCNNSTDYIYTGAWGTVAFDIDVSAVPRGKTVSSMRAFVCARLHFPLGNGGFQGRVRYWNPTTNDGQRKFVGNYGDTHRLPSVGLGGINVFRLYEVATTILIPISPTAKPSTGRMVLRLSGENLDVSQVFLSIGYPTDPLPPF